jgi:riboflavin biosynthesis pyrimidine reductase
MFHAGIDVSPAPGIQRNDHLRALALLDLVCGNVSGTSAVIHSQDGFTTSRAEVLVVIDWDTLRNGVSATSTVRGGYGLELPVETVRRMACDARIIPVVMNGAGEVLDVGRAKRLASPAQRKALYAMHSTCAITECQVKIEHCVPHHIDYWESGGSTDLSNLVPLCSRHHHAAHEGGWKLKLEAGHKLNGSLLREACVDEFLVYLAPQMLGSGRGMAQWGPLDNLSQALRLEFTETQLIGKDLRVLAKVEV